MMRIHTTPGCAATRRVQLALAVAGTPYDRIEHPDGWFQREHRRNGPMLEDGPLHLFEINAILRHVARTSGALWPRDPAAAAIADQWMDFALSNLRPAFMRFTAGEREPIAVPLAILDAALADRDWLAGEPTVADVAFLLLAALPAHGVSLEPYPRLAPWLERIAALAS